MDFKQIAEECIKNEKINEGFIKYISMFFSNKEYYVIAKKDENDNPTETIIAIINEQSHTFIFTDKEFAENTINEVIKDEEDKIILKYPMESIYNYLLYFKENGIQWVSINYGEYGIEIDINYLLQIYKFLVLNKKGDTINYKEGTKIRMTIPKNIDEIRSLLKENESKYTEIKEIYCCYALIEKDIEEYDKAFIFIPIFKEEMLEKLSEIEQKRILFELNSILCNFLQKDDNKDSMISFNFDKSIFPEELIKNSKCF